MSYISMLTMTMWGGWAVVYGASGQDGWTGLPEKVIVD
jgi:hypothetical protein